MLSPITAANLSELPGIEHGFFTRQGGVSDGIYAGLNCGMGSRDDKAKVIENRVRVALHLKSKSPNILTPYQIHSDTALIVDGPFPENEPPPKADALVTKTPNLIIGILTADCGPVLFADTDAGVVGAAHAGWRGAIGGILQSTVAAMETLGAQRDRIDCAIGPCINQLNYEVGPEFFSNFTAKSQVYEKFFQIPSGQKKEHFDLPGFIEAELTKLDIRSISNHAACTYADESRFFSFRRSTHRDEPDYGRQISAISVA
ncbi:MAG: peptidoglycan editing factor PgeF [Filomicrobium sp.]